MLDVTTADESRRHLLLSLPDLDVEHNPCDVVDAVIEGTIYEVLTKRGASSIVLLADVQRELARSLQLRYETGEIAASIERLGARRRLTFLDERHKGFKFDETRFHQLEGLYRQRHEVIDLARDEWFNELRNRHSLSSEQLGQLWLGLEQFTAELVNLHAAEAAAYLYLGREGGSSRFESVLSSKLPKIHNYVAADIVQVAEQEFPRFFEPTTAIRTDCIADRVRGAFFFHLLSLDPSASALVRESVSGKTLYLDTNFIYRLLGFHGPALCLGPATTIEVCRQLNCKLFVSRETLKEFVRSLRTDGARLRAMPIERDTYKRIAAEAPGDETAFLGAYYREWLSGRVKSVGDFERKYTNIEAFLPTWGVEIDEAATLSDSMKVDKGFVDELSQLNQWHGQHKTLAVLEHDLFMLHLIREKRGSADRTPAAIREWFITYDRRLTAFAAWRATGDRLAGAMLGDSWLQLTRPFLPRTDNYQKSFVAMLRHPLHFHEAKVVPFDHIVQALSRLDRFEELPTAVVSSILADGEFIRRFRDAKDEQAEREILELKLGQLAVAAEQKNTALVDDAIRAVARIQVLEDALELEKRDSSRVTEALTRARHQSAVLERQAGESLGNAQRDHAREMAELRRTLDTTLAQFRKESRQRLNWLAYAAIVGLFSIALVAFMIREWPALSGMELIAVGCWFSLICLCLLVLPLRHRASTLIAAFGWIVSVLGLLGLTYQLVESKSSPTRQSTPPAQPKTSGPVRRIPAT